LPGATEAGGAASTGVTRDSEYEKIFVGKTRLGRRGQPADIAKLQFFLLPMTLPGSQGSKFPFQEGCMVFKVIPKMKVNKFF